MRQTADSKLFAQRVGLSSEKRREFFPETDFRVGDFQLKECKLGRDWQGVSRSPLFILLELTPFDVDVITKLQCEFLGKFDVVPYLIMGFGSFFKDVFIPIRRSIPQKLSPIFSFFLNFC